MLFFPTDFIFFFFLFLFVSASFFHFFLLGRFLFYFFIFFSLSLWFRCRFDGFSLLCFLLICFYSSFCYFYSFSFSVWSIIFASFFKFLFVLSSFSIYFLILSLFLFSYQFVNGFSLLFFFFPCLSVFLNSSYFVFLGQISISLHSVDSRFLPIIIFPFPYPIASYTSFLYFSNLNGTKEGAKWERKSRESREWENKTTSEIRICIINIAAESLVCD